MRVVGGRHRRRVLAAPPGRRLRPTSDRTREAIFNLLAHRDDVTLDRARVLDAFAGTGAMGIEALSRGAAHGTFMDKDREAVAFCRKNLRTLDEDRGASTVLLADCLTPPPAPAPCPLVFLDPPYGEGLAAPALEALAGQGWIADGAVCTVELEAREAFDPPEGFETVDDRRYGAARVMILRRIG